MDGKDLASSSSSSPSSTHGDWFLQFLLNFLSYSLILVPSAVLVYLVKTGKCPPRVSSHWTVVWFVHGISPWQARSSSTRDGSRDESTDLLQSTADLSIGSPDVEASISAESVGPVEQEEFKITIERSYKPTDTNPFNVKSVLTLASCAVGLQVTYLTWGVLQEKIMTTSYRLSPSSEGTGAIESPRSHIRFVDSQFLVFINRIWAFILALVAVYVSHRRRSVHPPPVSSLKDGAGHPPLYEFMYSSLSNILSSWCQYEALKFVNFPTQVLSKACKLIPVMIMSHIVSGKRYRSFEYLCALGISLGMSLFLFGNHQESSTSVSDSHHGTSLSSGILSGILILALYLTFDSFTSNWQAALFERHPSLSSLEMMAATNLFSVLFTLTSLVSQGSLGPAMSLLISSGQLASDCFLLSLCSALGQLLVFFTIHQFGALVFVTIMTVRQAVAIPLSCLLFGHSLAAVSMIGILIVFSTLFTQTYLKYKFRPRRGRSKRSRPIR